MAKLDQVRTDILEALEQTPGMCSQEITDHLRALGHDVDWETVQRRMTYLRQHSGLKLQMVNQRERRWYLPEDAPDEGISLSEAVMEVMHKHREPMTTKQIAALVISELNRPCTPQKVSSRLTKLAKAHKVHRAGIVEHTSNRLLWALGPAEDVPVEEVEADPSPADEYTQHNSEADHLLNERTLALVPNEHMPAIRDAAKRMREFRYTVRRFGLARVSKTDACDWPIRKLFEAERDDRREVRYCALALWLSWQEAS